ncbi:MAG: cytochrome c maturation protein CcmE [Chloroflexi bacterium]|nr:cytochrome c maturation protein CcmE [Chloroflexota bacterium]
MSQAASHYPELLTEEDEDVGFAGKWKALIGFLVLMGALGYFAFMAFQSATVYYFTVSEMNDEGTTPQGRVVRVSGKLVPSSFFREDGSTIANFVLTDGSQNLSAAHNGVLPDLFFNPHTEIILEGSFGPQRVFKADAIMVKCPSKYQSLEVESPYINPSS